MASRSVALPMSKTAKTALFRRINTFSNCHFIEIIQHCHNAYDHNISEFLFIVHNYFEIC